MEQTKDYCVFSQRMAAHLMLNGHKLLKVCPHKETPTKNVFYFPDTQDVRDCAKQYIQNRKS